MDDSREESEGTVAPATSPTLRGLHMGVQIAWFVLLVTFGVVVVRRLSDCDDGGFCFPTSASVAFVLVIGSVVWVVGWLLIALVSLAIGWAVRRVRRSDPSGDPA